MAPLVVVTGGGGGGGGGGTGAEAAGGAAGGAEAVGAGAAAAGAAVAAVGAGADDGAAADVGVAAEAAAEGVAATGFVLPPATVPTVVAVLAVGEVEAVPVTGEPVVVVVVASAFIWSSVAAMERCSEEIPDFSLATSLATTWPEAPLCSTGAVSAE